MVKSHTYDNICSKWDKVQHEAPHGSTLGPVLSVVYINDLPPHSPPLNAILKSVLFAQNTSITIYRPRKRSLEKLPGDIFTVLDKLFTANEFTLIFDKTDFVTFAINYRPPAGTNVWL